MQNRITRTRGIEDKQPQSPQPIGDILKELFAQYERRFPSIKISVLQTETTAV